MSLPDSPLGRAVAYPDRIDPDQLFAIARAHQRAELGLAGPLPFRGEDQWTAWELSWLGPRGKPQVAVAALLVPAESPSIIESKSLKLYLNGYAQTRFPDSEAVAAQIARDLSACAGAPVAVHLHADAAMDALLPAPTAGRCLDDLDIAIDRYGPPAPEELRCLSSDAAVTETWFSRLFRSNCPVTGQPDWADVQIAYGGQPIEPAGLLRYLVSFREQRDFHEQCVERIFLDIKARCRPQWLSVHARFTRRGGLDISPWRSDDPAAFAPGFQRSVRQ